MELTTKQLAEKIGRYPCEISSFGRYLGLLPKVIKTNVSRVAMWSDAQQATIENFSKIKKAFPKKNFKQLLEIEEEIVKAGYNKILQEDIIDNPLIKDKRFLQLSFFPSKQEITPFQFQDIED